MNIEDALRGVTSILLDTAPVIYHLEKNPLFAPFMERFFRLRAAQQIVLVTSPITLAECLMHPIRQGRHDLEAAYHALIVAGQATTFWPIGAEEATVAARLRGKYGLKLADSIQVAVALQARCDALLTNDADLKKVTETRVLLVGELET
jgi:predicted nucleic acid-binding protein